ncbi:hypothetical protein [Streptomyces sp. NPDC020681]|uniref:hypothetical protein n=1 Tax=Streptomyces sp. NPDC020681 TaxID=3365083 RepID=UPI0037A99254
MADDVNIVVRVRDSTRAGIASINASLNRLVQSANSMDKSFGSAAGTAISLAPALIPIASAAAPIAAGLGAATVAVGAFGAAVGPQVVAMGEAAKAEEEYTKAIEQHGKTSQEAVKAEVAYLAALKQLPPATRQAAAGLSVLKEEYKAWSDGLADTTMPVVTKSFAVFGALFPKLTPLVKGASGELDRFMTIVAGGIQSQGFDKFMQSFSAFATGALAKANDGLIRLTRTLDTGKVAGGLSEFMTFAKENGPLVGDTLKNVATALTNMVRAAADTGVGLLTVVNAFAKLVASLPVGLISTLLQIAIAFKAVKMASAGMAVAATALAAFRTQAIAAGTAAAASGTSLQALRGAFMALSRTVRLAVAGTGIGLLLIALSELSQMGRSTPPNVDRLTTSLGNLARTGKVSGEAARAFGKDLGGLTESLNLLISPSNGQKIDRWISDTFSWDTDPLKKAKGDIDAVDKALAQLVSSGKGDMAAVVFKRMKEEMAAAGHSTKGLEGKFGEYKAAVADLKFEQQLAAEAMGLFGAQAQAVQSKLELQKQSTDGLRQSIHALNEAYLIARGGVRGMEAAIDAATAAFKENGKTLDNNTEKGRANNQALDDLAGATMKAVEAVRDSGGSWETASAIYARGRGELIKSATQMGLTKAAAARLADQILKTPNKTAFIKGNMQDLQQKLAHAKNQLARVPDSRKASVRARIDQLTAAIAKAKRDLASLHDKSVNINVRYNYSGKMKDLTGRLATGGVVGAAGGGPRSRMTLVGEQGPELVDLAPGSRVHSNPDTRRMMSGSDGQVEMIQVNLHLEGKQVAQVLIDPLRREVSSRGGVVNTLGKL